VAGVRLTRRRLHSDDVTVRGGLPTTTPLRTALDPARIRPLDEAVITLHHFLRPGLVFLDDVRAAAAVATGRGCRQVRAAVDRADGLAESPQETRLRLLLHRSDQHVAVEYDGAWHGEPGQFARDRQRLDRLTAAGWRVVFVTAADLHDPERLIARALASPRFA
jgi:hypothetical protein